MVRHMALLIFCHFHFVDNSFCTASYTRQFLSCIYTYLFSELQYFYWLSRALLSAFLSLLCCSIPENGQGFIPSLLLRRNSHGIVQILWSSETTESWRSVTQRESMARHIYSNVLTSAPGRNIFGCLTILFCICGGNSFFEPEHIMWLWATDFEYFLFVMNGGLGRVSFWFQIGTNNTVEKKLAETHYNHYAVTDKPRWPTSCKFGENEDSPKLERPPSPRNRRRAGSLSFRKCPWGATRALQGSCCVQRWLATGFVGITSSRSG